MVTPAASKAVGATDATKNTAHLSVMDRWGGAAALTTTVNTSFGSCVVARGTGVLLNNEMDDFAVESRGAQQLPGLVQRRQQRHRPGEDPRLLDDSHPGLPARSPRADIDGGGEPRWLVRIVTTVLQALIPTCSTPR